MGRIKQLNELCSEYGLKVLINPGYISTLIYILTPHNVIDINVAESHYITSVELVEMTDEEMKSMVALIATSHLLSEMAPLPSLGT